VAVYRIDPLHDRRWVEFLERQPRASIFHTPGWLQSLQRTYGYEPLAFTTTPPGADLTDGMAFCRVRSWLSGERLVSLPFADHCDLLFERSEEAYEVLDWLGQHRGSRSYRQIELRPRNGAALGLPHHTPFRAAQQFRLHMLDLRPDLQEITGAFDRDNIQRRLRRVERGDLAYEEGNSPALLKKFYYLQVRTRRRHHIPPQPLQWFSNLLQALGEQARIRVVSCGDRPVASILTLRYKESATFKYGCSDARYHHLAGTPFLLWEAIREAKASHAMTFDMGRSDEDNSGLIAFKSRWGAQDIPLTYWQCPVLAGKMASLHAKGRRLGGYAISLMPDSLLIFLGRTLYRHAG
jgi:Acetyltransferase (GNAT) domain